MLDPCVANGTLRYETSFQKPTAVFPAHALMMVLLHKKRVVYIHWAAQQAANMHEIYKQLHGEKDDECAAALA